MKEGYSSPGNGMEDKRYALEVMQRVEVALAERIRHSSQWLPVSYRPQRPHVGRTLSLRESRAQQWDARTLIRMYNDARSTFSQSKGNAEYTTPSVDAFLDAVESLDDKVSSPATDLNALLHRQTSSRGLNRLLCPHTMSENTSVDNIYTTGEDYGQYLDLVEHHMQWQSLPGSQPISYREYLQEFSSLDVGNVDYLQRLRTYLESVYDRFRPLDGSVRDHPLYRQTLLDIISDPLWCHVCSKLFASTGVFNAHLTGRKHRRAMTVATTPGEHTLESIVITGPNENMRIIGILAVILSPEIRNTVANLDRRQGLSERERELETEARERRIQEENEYISEDDAPSSTAMVPLGSHHEHVGPDGTPIPPWLYKLWGLGVEFRCEVCGGYKYRSRPLFEKHFRMSRHRSGLQSLGIEPSEAFNGITVINEALDLQRQLARHRTPTTDVEVEDEDGNVMSQRMYDDLKRQGLL